MSEQGMSDAMQALEVLLEALDESKLSQVDADEASAAGAELLMHIRQAHARETDLAARLETALGLLREVMPSGSHQHVGECWFCRAKTILATVDADTADTVGRRGG